MTGALSLQRQMVVFEHMGDEYAMRIEDVREILGRPRVRQTRSVAHGVSGVISLRGEIISLVDFGVIMGCSPVIGDPASRVIVCQAGGVRAGLAVERVREVLTIPVDSLTEAPETAASFICAIAQVGTRLILIIDPGEFVAGATEAEAA